MLNSFQTLQPNSVAPSLYAKRDKPSGLGFNFMKKIVIKNVGKKINRLTIIKFLRENKHGQPIVEVLCECGVIKEANLYGIVGGHVKSCGCLLLERIKEVNTKHGLAQKHPIYSLWQGIRTRCYNKKVKQYKDYGGRGIYMCKEWYDDFIVFYNWCINNNWKQGLDIDRFPNNDGIYEPSNCRFISRSKNCRNKRNNHIISFNGKEMTLTEWCEHLGINFQTMSHRLKLGWSIQKAFTTKVRKRIA